MLDLVNKAFDQVSFTIKMPVIFTLHEAIAFRWNHRKNAFGSDRFKQLVRIIAFIGNQDLRREVSNQRSGVRAVMTLAARQMKTQRIAQCVNGNVNLGGKATATAT